MSSYPENFAYQIRGEIHTYEDIYLCMEKIMKLNLLSSAFVMPLSTLYITCLMIKEEITRRSGCIPRMSVTDEGFSEGRSKALQRTLPFGHLDRSISIADAKWRACPELVEGISVAEGFL